MLVAAIKCDFCSKTVEISPTKGNATEIPDGWATIGSIISIKGTPQGERGKAYRERRDSLRKRFKKSHCCLDCIELILTGKNSMKIEMGETNGQESVKA